MSRKTEPRDIKLESTKKGNCADCNGRGRTGMYLEACNYCNGTGFVGQKENQPQSVEGWEKELKQFEMVLEDGKLKDCLVYHEAVKSFICELLTHQQSEVLETVRRTMQERMPDDMSKMSEEEKEEYHCEYSIWYWGQHLLKFFNSLSNNKS